MIKIVNGNLLDAEESIIAHQVNVHGIMGAGVALQIAKNYPEVNELYKEICSIARKDELISKVAYFREDDKTIANMFCQNANADKCGCLTNYDAMRKCFVTLNNSGSNIAIPYGIGCGIARGDWETVYKIIEDTCVNINVTIYKLKKE